MDILLNYLNSTLNLVKKYKVESEGLLSMTQYKNSAEITLYIGKGNSNKVMGKLIEEGYEFEKRSFGSDSWLEYQIEFRNLYGGIGGLSVSFIKERVKS